MAMKQKVGQAEEGTAQKPAITQQQINEKIQPTIELSFVEFKIFIQDAKKKGEIKPEVADNILTTIENKDYVGMISLVSQHPQIEEKFKQIVIENARAVGITKEMIDDNSLWQYFKQYISEISQNQDASKRATAEFAAQELLKGKMLTDFAKDTVDETKMV